MRWLRLVLRVLGWLLTPLVAWAACFSGAAIGALVASGLERPTAGLIVTATFGAVTGFAVLLFWMRLLRRSPRLRHSLHVTVEGIPDTAELLTEEPSDVKSDVKEVEKEAAG